jgi:DNA adenine methylase
MSQPLKWHGGKHYLASWILSHFPAREAYTHYAEPYAGGLSVLFAHDPEGKSETVNDVNGELINFWSVLASHEYAQEFIRAASCIPLSEDTFAASKYWSDKPEQCSRVERALFFFVRYRQSRQGLGKDYTTPTKRTRRGMNEQVSAWLSAVDGLPEAHQRLRSVELRNKPAMAFIREYDHPQAMFYCDPPYLHETRVTTSDYEYEMSPKDHQELVDCLATIEGKFLLSGYDSEMYRDAAAKHGWRSVSKEIDNKASGKKNKEKKIEWLWMNY